MEKGKGRGFGRLAYGCGSFIFGDEGFRVYSGDGGRGGRVQDGGIGDNERETAREKLWF